MRRQKTKIRGTFAQALYSISWYIDATQMALENDKIEVIKTNLDELIALSREAMANMRLLIFQLRPPALEEVGLVTSLKSRLGTVESRAGIQVVFHSEGELPLTARSSQQCDQACACQPGAGSMDG